MDPRWVKRAGIFFSVVTVVLIQLSIVFITDSVAFKLGMSAFLWGSLAFIAFMSLVTTPDEDEIRVIQPYTPDLPVIIDPDPTDQEMQAP